MAFTGIGKLLKDFVINTLTTNDKTIPGGINELFSCSDRNAINNSVSDCLNIDISGNLNSPNMKPGMIATENTTSLKNAPPVGNTPFYALRKVYVVNSKINVKLYEIYPHEGRIWSTTYDQNLSNWTGTWRCSDDDIGKSVQGFANVLYVYGGSGSYIANIIGTKVGYNLWRYDIRGILSVDNPGSVVTSWGIDITKFPNASGRNLGYSAETLRMSSFCLYNNSGVRRLNLEDYGTTFEVYTDTIFRPARYYTPEGTTGGWQFDAFESGKMYCTIYLLEG